MASNRFRSVSLFLVPAIIVLLVTTAFGAVGGSISGTVKDQTGGVIPGVMLTLTNMALGTQFKTTTDAQGLFTFPSLPVGRYDLTIEAVGFTAQKKPGLVVDADSALQVNCGFGDTRTDQRSFRHDD